MINILWSPSRTSQVMVHKFFLLIRLLTDYFPIGVNMINFFVFWLIHIWLKILPTFHRDKFFCLILIVLVLKMLIFWVGEFRFVWISILCLKSLLLLNMISLSFILLTFLFLTDSKIIFPNLILLLWRNFCALFVYFVFLKTWLWYFLVLRKTLLLLVI